MQMNRPSDEDLALWEEYLRAERAFWKARKELFTNASSLVELVRAGLFDPAQRPSALGVAALLKEEERKRLFPELLGVASFVSGSTLAARDLVLSLPKEWVLANVEEAAEPLLRDGSYEEYRALFEVYIRLDRSLAEKLAHRAAKETDEDIKEGGQDFLARLNANVSE